MSTVAIDRFTVRYRTPPGDVRAQPRLQRIVIAAVEHMLEGALDRAGVGREEIVCIRDLRSVVRLRLREPDSMLTAAFGEALARDIAAAARGSSASTVIYRSRAHAIIDLAIAAASGDASRTWAWNQIGIWHDAHPTSPDAMARAVMRALVDEPRNAIAVLAYLARTHKNAFCALMDRAEADAWTAVARAAAASAGAPASWLDDRSSPGEREPLSEAEWLDRRTADERVRRLVARCVWTSAIAQASLDRIALGRGEPLETLSSGAARRLTAVAMLAILEVEPACVSANADRLSLMLSAAERELCDLASSAVRLVDNGAAEPRRARETPPPSARELQTIEPRDVSGDPIADGLDDSRRSASTRFGGVLFLLNVADAVGLPARLEDDDRLAGRGVRWTLHQIAVLLGGDPADAAVLAFAGLPPDQPPPSTEQPPTEAAELAALHDHRRTLLHAVRERLGHRDDPDEALTRFVCARHGSIVADPGWIEMHLPADEVSIDIRRGGLDRDPGWVPWLGVVVRFRYV